MRMEHRAEPLQSPASHRRRELLPAQRQAWPQGVPDFEQFEHEGHEHILNLERECLAEEVAPYDGTAERSEVGGVSYQPVWQAAAT